MATVREKAFDEQVVPGGKKANAYLDMKTSHVADKVWQRPIKRGGQNVAALQELADSKTIGLANQAALAKLDAKVSGLVGAIAAINQGEVFDQAKLLASIEEATRRGVTAAIGSITETTVVEFNQDEDEAAQAPQEVSK